MNAAKLDALFERAIAARAFPSAVVAVGDAENVYYKKAFGCSRVFSDGSPCFDAIPTFTDMPDGAEKAGLNTLYDMASLTKLLSTSMIAFRFVEDGIITMRDTLGMYFDSVPEDKKNISIFHLMTHTSGITAHFHLGGVTDDHTKAAEVILNYPLSHKTGEAVEVFLHGLYSSR